MSEQEAGRKPQPEATLSILAEMSAAKQGVRTGTLIFVTEDGAPQPQRVWCAELNASLYLATPPLSMAAQRLHADGRVCLLLDGSDPEEQTITGVAEHIPTVEEQEPVLARLTGRGPTARLLFRLVPTTPLPSEALEDPADRRLVAQHVFSDLPRTVARAMSHRLRYETFEAGAMVIRQGSQGDEFFIVVDGEVDVIQEQPEGGERLLATLGPGESFGEAALLLDTPRTATVRARTPLRVLALDKRAFEQVMLLSNEADTR